jgi:O-antigen chain-terminating methyltransferase
LSLEALAQRYDRQADQRSAHIEERLTQADQRSAHIEERLIQADQRSAQLENGAAQITERLSQVQAQLQGMLNSRSWRITAPMRRLAGAVRSARQRLVQFFSITP